MKTREKTKTHGKDEKTTTKDGVARHRLRRRTCMGPAEMMHIIQTALQCDVSVAASPPLSSDVDLGAAIPTIRNHLYAKAKNNGTF